MKFIFIGKMREKSRRRQTGSSGVLSPTFGQIVNRARWVRKTGRHHISTSGLASGALGVLFLPYSGLYCRGIVHRRLEMLSVRKLGAPNLNLWPESTIQKPEVLSKVPEMVRKVVKFIVNRNTSWSNVKWICKTGSSCVLWPTFGQIGSRGRFVKKTGRRHISTSVWPLEPQGRSFLPYQNNACIVAVSHIDG